MSYYYDDAVASGIGFGIGFGYIVFLLVVYVLAVIGLWKMFEKAGEPGWMAIIPIVNMYKLFKIAWGKGILFLLLLIPIVNIVIEIVMLYKLAKAFGHGAGMTILSIFLSPLAYIIMGFSQDSYAGPQ